MQRQSSPHPTFRTTTHRSELSESFRFLKCGLDGMLSRRQSIIERRWLGWNREGSRSPKWKLFKSIPHDENIIHIFVIFMHCGEPSAIERYSYKCGRYNFLRGGSCAPLFCLKVHFLRNVRWLILQHSPDAPLSAFFESQMEKWNKKKNLLWTFRFLFCRKGQKRCHE